MEQIVYTFVENVIWLASWWYYNNGPFILILAPLILSIIIDMHYQIILGILLSSGYNRVVRWLGEGEGRGERRF